LLLPFFFHLNFFVSPNKLLYKTIFLLFFFACPKKNETRLPVKLPKVVRQEKTFLQDALFALTSPMLHKFLPKLRFASRYFQHCILVSIEAKQGFFRTSLRPLCNGRAACNNFCCFAAIGFIS
jgi:hypothetical protein